MDLANKKNIIWARIRTLGPQSIVLPPSTDDHQVALALISELETEMQEEHFVAVTIPCEKYTTILDFWKALTMEVWKALCPVMQPQLRSTMENKVLRMAQSQRTIDLFNGLLHFLKHVREKQGLKVVLILEKFAALVELQDESDAMKIRQLTDVMALLTLSEKPLVELADKYKNEYFCNQFVALQAS
ncbi:MAG: hypothetical protein IKO85_00230 [Bacteroidaceae bacterium]|jgi:hypothetical protein|nr:hypothetical protein [Bacteroidaceae bacterium]